MKKTALITGASSGIGKELAIIHAQNGGNLVIVARREDKLNSLKVQLEGQFKTNVLCIAKDLSQVGSAKALYNEVKSLGIKVDYLINNAGFGLCGKFHELSWERQQQMMSLNMNALTELMYLFLQEMVERNEGKILNNSSTASYLPGPLQAVYFATKSYVQFLSNAVAEELSDTNVSVTNLMPGATETEFAKTANLEKTDLFKNAFSPKTVAKDGYEAMLAGELDVVSGVTFAQKIMLSMAPLTPKKVLLKQMRKMQEA